MILTIDDKYLRQPTQQFDFSNPPLDPYQLSKDLIETMYSKNGLGLAANQCGIPYSVFVMRGSPADFAIFNPKIVHQSDEVNLDIEGCLSFPGLGVKLKRPNEIRIRFADYNGEIQTQKFHMLTARIASHEIDHLNGIVYYEKANKFHRDQGFRQRERNKK